MLRRLDFIQLHDLVPLGVFAFTAGIFLFIFYKSIKMKKETADRLASLPLDDDAKTEGGSDV